jgi:hypothetical protein
MRTQSFKLLTSGSLKVLLGLFLLIWVVQSAAAQSTDIPTAGQQSNQRLYLPLVMDATADGNNGDGGDDSGDGGDDPCDGGGGPSDGDDKPGALWLPYTLTDESVLPTYGTSVAVDTEGGIHVTYAIYAGTDEFGHQPATYAYCNVECADLANWSSTQLGETVREVRLVLNPAGHPRLMLYGSVPDPDWPRMRYQYAACDSDCTRNANWTITTIATPIEPTATREYNNNRYFAISRHGVLAFIYTDTIQNDHPGTFYMSCQSGCTDANQWIETTLASGALFDKPSLAFSPDGYPRLAFGVSDEEQNLLLAYTQCDQDCQDGTNWPGVLLSQIHGSAKFNLQVDSTGQPRLGFYSGSYAASPFEDRALYYLWCGSNCTAAAENWYLTEVELPLGSGDGVDLALDGQDRPRMSFETGNQGLGFAWCDSGCESGEAHWQSMEVESQAALANDYEVLPIHRCTVSTWFNGQRTSLALDPTGNPRIAYDAQHWWYGVENVNGVPRECNYQDVTVTRLALFDNP